MIAGCDEAGRGCLAGPVVAAAVMARDGVPLDPRITDSKKCSPILRAELYEWIMAHCHVGIGICGPDVIDDINILQASIRAMHSALDQLSFTPELVLVDGHYFIPYGSVDHRCEVKGDSRIPLIGAASIIAKHHRDQLMIALDRQYPPYHWARNMGYPTKQHRRAIQEYGITSHHRKSFRLTRSEVPNT